MMRIAYVYVLKCSDGSFYTGWTRDLGRRLSRHAAGKAAKYTRSRRPIQLAAWFLFECDSAARRFEARFKRLRRAQKAALLEQGQAFGVRGSKEDAWQPRQLPSAKNCAR